MSHFSYKLCKLHNVNSYIEIHKWFFYIGNLNHTKQPSQTYIHFIQFSFHQSAKYWLYDHGPYKDYHFFTWIHHFEGYSTKLDLNKKQILKVIQVSSQKVWWKNNNHFSHSTSMFRSFGVFGKDECTYKSNSVFSSIFILTFLLISSPPSFASSLRPKTCPKTCTLGWLDCFSHRDNLIPLHPQRI